MGKSLRTDKEFTKNQQILHENKKLKREIAKLRKILAKIDLDRYSQVKEMIEEYRQQDSSDHIDLLDKLKQEWKCQECPIGYLEITLFNKLAETWYYRCCSNCPHRTKTQKYSPEVRGIIKKTPQNK